MPINIFFVILQQQQMQSTMYPSNNDSSKVYTDLSESRPVTSQLQQNSRSSISVIPTPVSTTTTTSQHLTHHQQHHIQSQAPQIPSHIIPPSSLNIQNNLNSSSSTNSTHTANLTLNEIHQQMAYKYQQQNRSIPTMHHHHVPHLSQISPASSFNSSQGWDSPRSTESGFSSGPSGDYAMEDESRGRFIYKTVYLFV